MYDDPDKMAIKEEAMSRCYEQIQSVLRVQDPVPGFSSKGPALITNYLYLGDFGDAASLGLLSELGITHLLNCAGVASNGGYFRPPLGGGTSPRCYKQLEALDREDYDMLSHFDEACQYIDEARSSRGKVLVYCMRGVNRSAAICVAYLMARDNADLCAAVTEVAFARGQVLTNPGFQRQLVEFAAKHNRLPVGDE